MTKNRIAFAAIAASSLIALAVFQNLAYAQESAPTPPNKDARDENKENRGTIRDLLGQGKETLTERIKLRGANILSRSNIRIDRITKAADKISSVAQKFVDKGIDVGEAQNLVQSAREKLDQATSMQGEAQTILDGLTVDTLKTDVSAFKTKMMDSYKLVVESRKDLMSAVQTLKTIRSSAKTTETIN